MSSGRLSLGDKSRPPHRQKVVNDDKWIILLARIYDDEYIGFYHDCFSKRIEQSKRNLGSPLECVLIVSEMDSLGPRYSGSGDIGYWFVDFRGPGLSS